MIKFVKNNDTMEFHYRADLGSNSWIHDEFKTQPEVVVSSVFHFQRQDFINSFPQSDDAIDTFVYIFNFGNIENGYVIIDSRKLGIENNICISLDIDFARNIFAAERNISVFGHLAALINHKNPIFIGGSNKEAVPESVFQELLEKFPNSYEMNRYASARVSTILSQYIDGMEDARGRYEKYLSRKMDKGAAFKIDLEFLKKQEIEKYILIRDMIKEALDTKKEMSESEWQKLMIAFILLLFPKYIKVLENVTINDYYSKPDSVTHRFIDIALVDVNGNLDVIEIKKPFDDKILRKSQYRDNSIPTSELSGSIMQAEKYLFHLTKWGIKGEKVLTEKYSRDLPPNMKIRISNPKAIIILGRDHVSGANMTGQQSLDFEVIKRKYANVMDIITYDDLLRRLNNIIISLGGAP